MTVRHVIDLNEPIGRVMRGASRDGVLIETGGRRAYALMALDDNLVDYLLERNPRFIRACRAIKAQMKRGKYVTHEQLQILRRVNGDTDHVSNCGWRPETVVMPAHRTLAYALAQKLISLIPAECHRNLD